MKEARRIRIELAAAYRLAARFGLNEGISNHFTARAGENFLVIPHGLHFREVTASRLLLVDPRRQGAKRKGGDRVLRVLHPLEDPEGAARRPRGSPYPPALHDRPHPSRERPPAAREPERAPLPRAHRLRRSVSGRRRPRTGGRPSRLGPRDERRPVPRPSRRRRGGDLPSRRPSTISTSSSARRRCRCSRCRRGAGFDPLETTSRADTCAEDRPNNLAKAGPEALRGAPADPRPRRAGLPGLTSGRVGRRKSSASRVIISTPGANVSSSTWK